MYVGGSTIMKSRLIRGLDFGISVLVIMLLVMNSGLTGIYYKIIMVISLIVTCAVVDQILNKLT